jgi:hypothetical protein
MEVGQRGKVGTHSVEPAKVEFRGRNHSRRMQSRSSRPLESVDFTILGIKRVYSSDVKAPEMRNHDAPRS